MRVTLSGWVLLSLLMAVQIVAAGQLPTGLNGRERVYLQEYWKEGVPGYCVANRRDRDIHLRVARWRSRDQDASPLFGWDVPAQATVCREAPASQGEWLLHVSLADGTELGLLKAPARARPADGRRVASDVGLNGYCAQCGFSLEQETLCHDAGAAIHLDLLLPGDAGILTLPRDGEGEHPGLEALTLIRASSETLPVRVLDSVVEVDAGAGARRDQVQRVHLEFAGKAVTAATLFTLSAQLRGAGRRRCCLTRGVCVRPARQAGRSGSR